MYLPSKLQSKYIALIAISLFLFILPFHNTVRHIFALLSEGLTLSPHRLSSKISQLEKENIKLDLEANAYALLKEENESLKKALKFKEEKRVELIGAKVIAFNPSNWRRIIVIDIGENDGIRDGSFAIDENGWLLGKIIGVKKNYSYLMLVNDPDFNIPVIVGQSSMGLLQGGLDEVKVLYLERDKDIKVGDDVWFKAGSFSLPLYVGEVKSIGDSKNSLFWDVEVKMFSQAFALRNVFIVK